MPLQTIYPDVTIEESGLLHKINGVSTSIAAFVGYTPKGIFNKAVRIFSFIEYENLFGGLHQDSLLSYAIWQFFQNGGRDAYVVRVAGRPEKSRIYIPKRRQFSPRSRLSAGIRVNEYTLSDTADIIPNAPDLIGTYADKTGIYALQDVDSFNLLVIPDTTRLPHDSGKKSVIEAAIRFCEEYKAMYLIDPDPEKDASSIINWASAIRSRNAALYFPQIGIADPLNGSSLTHKPPSGAIAGVFARTDERFGVWKAAAGTRALLNGASGLAYQIRDREKEMLTQAFINCLQTFQGNDVMIWGARTLTENNGQDQEWKYISVRRLTLFVEESIDRGTEWATFESNDATLWNRLLIDIETFMYELFLKGAFQGANKKDAYFVKCDSETTTPNDIIDGSLNILVGFAPLKPAEFTIIRIKKNITV